MRRTSGMGALNEDPPVPGTSLERKSNHVTGSGCPWDDSPEVLALRSQLFGGVTPKRRLPRAAERDHLVAGPENGKGE